MSPQVSIIGLGNWGSSLAHAVTVAKTRLGEVVAGERALRRRPRWARSLPITSFARARLDADVIWLCVPDAAIARAVARVVEQRGSKRLRGQIVVHSSGALDAQVLEAAAAAGASIAAVHPMMTFPTRTPVPLQGVPFAVEAEGASRRVLHALVRRLGGRPFPIQSEGKTLYHLAGMLSSPLLVSHLLAAGELASRAGLSRHQALQVIEPITRATLDNFFRQGAGKSFSGPIARENVETIRLHLQALEPHPMLAGVYRSLALYAVDMLGATGSKKLRSALLAK